MSRDQQASAIIPLKTKSALTYIAKGSSDDDCSTHQKPICQRDVDVSINHLGRMSHLDTWKIGQIYGLREKLEDAGNHGLRSNDRSQN